MSLRARLLRIFPTYPLLCLAAVPVPPPLLPASIHAILRGKGRANGPLTFTLPQAGPRATTPAGMVQVEHNPLGKKKKKGYEKNRASSLFGTSVWTPFAAGRGRRAPADRLEWPQTRGEKNRQGFRTIRQALITNHSTRFLIAGGVRVEGVIKGGRESRRARKIHLSTKVPPTDQVVKRILYFSQKRCQCHT